MDENAVAALFVGWVSGLGMGYLLGRIKPQEAEPAPRPRSMLDLKYCPNCDHYVTPLLERGNYATDLVCPRCKEELDLWL